MPQLLGTRDINGRGYFMRLPIGSPSPNQVTLMFVPPSYRPSATVDVIVFLHGFMKTLPDIRGYFSDPDRGGIWAGIESSGKNVVLVAPSLGPNPELASQVSRIASADGKFGFPDFIDQVLQAMLEFGPQATGGSAPGVTSLPDLATVPTTQTRPALGNLILAGHSAGGSPLVNIAGLDHRYKNNHKECWCFDGWYYGSAGWVKWLKDNPGKTLRGFYVAGTGTEATAKTVDAAGSNAVIQADSGANHDTEPQRLMADLVLKSTHFSSI